MVLVIQCSRLSLQSQRNLRHYYVLQDMISDLTRKANRLPLTLTSSVVES